MRVALLSDLEAVPWLPLVAGVLEALEANGCTVELVRVGDMPAVQLWLLERRPFDLAVTLPHAWIVGRVRPFLRVLRDRGVPVVSLTYDDPYDLAHGIEIAPHVDLTVTPEVLAADCYDQVGHPAAVLPPVVSASLHGAPLPRDPLYDVFFLGGTHWTPRAAVLPKVRDWCTRTKRTYGEAAGTRRWITGPELGRVLSQTRLLLEIPRFSCPVRSNPYQVPCTYTSPRVHLAAATGTPCLIVERKADGAFEAFPSCGIGELIPTLARLLEPGNPQLDGAALAARREWLDRHQPRLWGRRFLDLVRARGLVGAGAAQLEAVR